MRTTLLRPAFWSAALLGLALVATAALAQTSAKPLRLFTEDATDTSFTVKRGDTTLQVSRVMTGCAKNEGWFQPLVPVPGVTPVGEAEMLHALNDPEAMIVDMRSMSEFLKATIPFAINIPFTEVALRMNELGCDKASDGKLNCSKAKKLYAFCNGPVCPQSPIAIRAITRDGFPANRIYYYRGGMLDWEALGLTTRPGEF
ncbi:MAG: rhodanese-like domain-containing protein [Ideonella sp.]|nr:rhodanese-like domain-containing protein [Ideonella sp.]